MNLESLPKEVVAALKKCSKTAFTKKINIFLVGGVVRDILLNQTTKDTDVCLEGDAVEFAKVLSEAGHAKILNIQPDLRTAKVEFASNVELDLASTRMESYPKASHLPVIENFYCPLSEDVKRRDFTVNAIAVSLNQDNFFEIVDYLGGVKDLNNKTLKILHDKSFIDDPSRIIRALKYAVRLDFELEANTQRLMAEYLETFNPNEVCYSRVLSELKQAFSFKPEKMLDKFIQEKIYKLFGVDAIKESYAEKITKAAELFAINPNWFTYFAPLFYDLSASELEILCERLNLENSYKKIFFDILALKSESLPPNYTNFDIYNKFLEKDICAICIYYAMSCDENALKYMREIADTKVLIKGNDLIKLGFEPSAKFREIFVALMCEKLDGNLKTYKEEIDFVKKNFVL